MGCTAVAGLAGVAASGGRAKDVAAEGLPAGVPADVAAGVGADLAAALAAAASALAASAAALASAFAIALASALESGFSAGAGSAAALAASRWGAAGMGRMVAAGSLAELLAEPMTDTPPELLAELLPGAPELVLVEATAMEGLPFTCAAFWLAAAGLPAALAAPLAA